MAQITQPGFLSLGLLEQASLRVGGRLVGAVGAPFATKIDAGVAGIISRPPVAF
jgi:hypothetical protein